MQLYTSRNIHFLYIVIFLDSLLEVLQDFTTLKQILFEFVKAFLSLVF